MLLKIKSLSGESLTILQGIAEYISPIFLLNSPIEKRPFAARRGETVVLYPTHSGPAATLN